MLFANMPIWLMLTVRQTEREGQSVLACYCCTLQSGSLFFLISAKTASLFCCHFLQFHAQASKRAQLRHWMNALIYSASASVFSVLHYVISRPP